MSFSSRLQDEHVAWNLASVAPAIKPGDRVLDLGAWDCRLGVAIRDQLGAHVVGADVIDKNATDLELRILDGGKVPTAPGETFDVVLLLYVLHHADDDRAVLAEARRILAPGGTIVVGEDRADTVGARLRTLAFHVWLLVFTWMGWRGKFRTSHEWRARFAEAGLTVSGFRTLGAGRWWFPVNDVYYLTPTATPARDEPVDRSLAAVERRVGDEEERVGEQDRHQRDHAGVEAPRRH